MDKNYISFFDYLSKDKIYFLVLIFFIGFSIYYYDYYNSNIEDIKIFVSGSYDFSNDFNPSEFAEYTLLEVILFFSLLVWYLVKADKRNKPGGKYYEKQKLRNLQWQSKSEFNLDENELYSIKFDSGKIKYGFYESYFQIFYEGEILRYKYEDIKEVKSNFNSINIEFKNEGFFAQNLFELNEKEIQEIKEIFESKII